MTDPDTSVAVVHKALTIHGGAERVAFEIARTFDAPLYATVVDESIVPDDVDARQVMDSRVVRWLDSQPFPYAEFVRDAITTSRWPYQPQLADYDVLIQTGIDPWFYVPEDHQTIVRYVHSPPRTAYDRHQVIGGALTSKVYAQISRLKLQQTLPYATAWIANSELVAKRIRKYLDPSIDPIVVYPPVDVDAFEPQPGDGYYVALSRLTDHKGIDDIVAAFERFPLGLFVLGDGECRHRFEALAADNIRVSFKGFVPESRKRHVLETAEAVVFAAENEDFGIVPIEAMAAGTPVIGVDEGFTRHQIQDGKTGILCDRDELCQGIARFEHEGVECSPAQLHEFARVHFGRERFRRQLRAVVDAAVERDRIDVDLAVPAVEDDDGERCVPDRSDRPYFLPEIDIPPPEAFAK